jgi:ABC-2 type transport system permease protein
MLRSVVLKVIHDQWRVLVVWTAVASLLSAFYLSLYPSIGAVDEMRRLLDSMPPPLRAMFASGSVDLTTAAGYLNIELFAFMLPLLVLAVTVTLGAGATAGEEERRTLELLLANPIPRWRIVLEKFVGLVLLAALFCLGIWIALAVTARVVSIDVALDRVGAALVSVWLLGLAVGTLAILVGALTGSRMLSMGIALGVAVAGFFVNALAPLADVLEPWRVLSPHYHYVGYDPLAQGLDLGHAAVLAALTAVFLMLAIVAFERRDLKT